MSFPKMVFSCFPYCVAPLHWKLQRRNFQQAILKDGSTSKFIGTTVVVITACHFIQVFHICSAQACCNEETVLSLSLFTLQNTSSVLSCIYLSGSLLLPRAEFDQTRLSQISIRSTNRLSPPAGKRVPLANPKASWSKALGIPSVSLTCLRISVYLQPVSCWLLPLHPAHTHKGVGEMQFSSILDSTGQKRVWKHKIKL